MAVRRRVHLGDDLAGEVAAEDVDLPGFGLRHGREAVPVGIQAAALEELIEQIHRRLNQRSELEIAVLHEGDVGHRVINAHDHDGGAGVQLVDAAHAGGEIVLEIGNGFHQRGIQRREDDGQLAGLLGIAEDLHKRGADIAALARDLFDLRGELAVAGALQLHDGLRHRIGQDVVRAEVHGDQIGLADGLQIVFAILIEQLIVHERAEGIEPNVVQIIAHALEHVAQLHGAERAPAELVELCVGGVGNNVMICARHAGAVVACALPVDVEAGGDAVADAHIGVIVPDVGAVGRVGGRHEGAEKHDDGQQQRHDPAGEADGGLHHRFSFSFVLLVL